MNNSMELVCPAGSLPALKAAVDNGADAVYMGFRDGTNARNFPGLNFDEAEARQGIEYAHRAGRKVFLAINTYPSPAQWDKWCAAVDQAAGLGVDALILADPGLMHYCTQKHPQQRLHLSVQGSATNAEAIAFYARQFGVRRVVLPRVLSLQQVRAIIKRVNVEIEVFGFGSLCVMAEGRCSLSSYVTGESPNMSGVCSPAKAVRWEETPSGRQSRLNGVLIDSYGPGEAAGYPTLCKGRFAVQDNANAAHDAELPHKPYYALEEPTSLNVLDILPQLKEAGVVAIKVEGRQRSPAYVAQVTRALRAALDACNRDPENYTLRREWVAALDKVAEGVTHTLGAYYRPWQ
ncbi:MAG: protease [Candidatus Muproteobacteria bacterium RBG_16_65_34]|uniref:Ubiquinone biosynthesis protein UbiU n=1 Tax=Candidatus Muproteobacteria bacterium RBG_16_65_34 TaxID=1817760 RepID=A0A1F6TVE1_9PROT|nr:MAG: protease [Candidatus Muproteobacteria bacterium RBG_16_65_34]